MQQRHQIGVYYFPNYHVDPRNEAVHGPGWTEWELVKRGEPRFPGHEQPKVPLWGYEDEADPRVFTKKIDAAADSGITHFIFDWYAYNDGPFLNRCLDEGYMGAENNSRLKFALMWANHNWTDIHPAKAHQNSRLLYPGAVTPEAFERITDEVVAQYFSHPSYWKIDDCPYFSIYEIMTLINSFGSLDDTKRALDQFREKTKAAGFPDLHLNAVVWGQPILPGETAPADPNMLLRELGFSSFTSYVWIHHVPLCQYPEVSYEAVSHEYEAYCRSTVEIFDLPYHPNVSMGWDSSSRTCQSDIYMNLGYPFMPVITGNTPEDFKRALQRCKAFMDECEDSPRIMNINSWNEWTEGSYLEPDTVNGMAYLDAIRDVFCKQD